jgi:phage gp46-like protein
MAYDFALDPVTGDFLFGPTRDIIGVTGPELDEQRISIRCKIPRGTFTYDEEGTLGSFLHLISRNPSRQQMDDARGYVAEALEDMDGISIDTIDVETTESGVLNIGVKFVQTSSLDEDEEEDVETDLPEFDANVMLGHLE